MRDMFSMTDEEWVRSFLLTADPYKDTKMLTEPFQGMHTLSGEHVFTVNKTVSGVSEPRVPSRWLLVPAFNHGTKAAGLFIQNKSDAVSADGSTMHIVRFVRNDETGEVLYITEIPGSGCVEVMHNLHDGPTRRRSAYLRFDSARFRRVFATNHFSADVAALRDALLTSCSITETRPCPRCGAMTGSVCGCVLAFRKAEHAFDFRFYKRNSENMFGTFSGRMTLSTYSAGQERSCQMYRVENTTQCTSSAHTQDLLHGAVQSRVQLLQVNPRALSVGAAACLFLKGASSSLPLYQGVSDDEERNLAPGDVWVFSDTIDRIAEDDEAVQPQSLGEDACESPTLDTEATLVLGVSPLTLSPTSTSWPRNAAAALKLSHGGRGVAPLLPRVGGAPTAAVDPKCVVTLDKSEMRKIKKREAAQRSNFKRHQRHVQLKAMLYESHERKQMLLRRKAWLENENRRLRQCLERENRKLKRNLGREPPEEDLLKMGSLFSPGPSMFPESILNHV